MCQRYPQGRENQFIPGEAEAQDCLIFKPSSLNLQNIYPEGTCPSDAA
jgi:hypothetical protein